MGLQKTQGLKSLLVLILVATFVFMCGIGIRVWQLHSFATQREIGAELIEGIRARRPENVPSSVWDNSVSWTRTAYFNVFSSRDNSTSEDLSAFVMETKDKLASEIDLESIDWIWNRLALTSPYGREYVERMWQDYKSVSDKAAESPE